MICLFNFKLEKIFVISFFLCNLITDKVTQEGRAVLITGCDFGYGYELAKKLRASNFTVFAGCSDAKSNGAISLKNLDNQTGRLHVIQMDVSNQEEVDDALHYVKEHLPENGLWGIVNNADESSCPGFLEWSPIENYEKVNIFIYMYTVLLCF